MKQKDFHKLLLISIIIILILSGINPYDRFTWFLEVFPVMIAGVVFTSIYSKFKFTNLAYVLIWMHAIILIIGGHYTYAQVPLFNWIRDNFQLSRNYYDRVGHIVQGFVPAIVFREIFIKKAVVKGKKWLIFLVICTCLAISAFYELVEFGVAKATGKAAEAFLGTQGDVWDTQWDMTFALIGASFSILFLGRCHDKLLNREKKYRL